MQRWLVVGIVLLFFGLIGLGIVRQQMADGSAQIIVSVPTLASTFSPALLPAPLTATATIAATFTPPPTPEPLVELPQMAATAVSPTTHTVQPGETLFNIARRYGISVNVLAAANQISNPGRILSGQVLAIPAAELALAQPSMPSPPTATLLTLPETPLTDVPNPLPEATAPTAPTITLNGIPISTIIVMPPVVVANARAIFAQGQAYGRNPHAYSKVGDSTIQNPHFMARFDQSGGYNLGPYVYLQTAVDYFAGSHSREGLAVRKGFHSWTVTDTLWADKTVCQANETPIACEIRVHNPAIILIRLGSNDAGVPRLFDQNLRQIVELAIANGIIPVIGTKADRFEGSNINNELLRQIAADYQLPLWDFDVAAQIIPGRGLDVDGVHLTGFFAHDYGSPTAFQRGHGVHSLTALMMLQTLLDEVILPDE